MDEMIFLPSRVHENDIAGTSTIADNHGYQHLNLPLLVDEPSQADRKSALTWFHETWADRLKADGDPVIIVSRIYEEGEGQG